MLEREIGAALRAGRIGKGFSVAELAERLHLKEAYVEAIERGESADLFPRSYLTGFLRSLAQQLSVDIEAEIDLLARNLREERDSETPVVPQVEKQGFRYRAQFLGIGGAILLLAALFSIGRSLETPDAPRLTADEVLANLKAQKRLVVATPRAAPPPASAAAPDPTAVTDDATPSVATIPRDEPLATTTAKTEEPASAAPVAPQDAEKPGRMRVVVRAVYLREKPTKNSDSIGTVARCSRVRVEQEDTHSGWVEVSNSLGRGYLYKTFLSPAVPSCDTTAER